MAFHLFKRDTLRAMGRRKSLAEAQEASEDSGPGLRRSLNAVDLILFGVGSSVGAGIFVLVGLGAKITGPAISLSFLGCGLACIFTSLAYAEFASRIPVSGSAFTYIYVAFGEFAAWIIGFFLILGYGFTASVTARAWGDYTGTFLMRVLPGHAWLLENMTELQLFGPSVNYTCSPLSLVIIGLGTFVLLRGAKNSSIFNNVMTIANICMLLLVVVAGICSDSIEPDNFEPFVPHGLPSVIQGAGLVFFAYLGFDQVASLSEEVINPERNMPIGITGSLIISTLIYVCVSLAVVGMAPFRFLGESVPIINALMVNACCSHQEQLEALDAESCLKDCHTLRIPWLATVAHIVSGGCIWGLSASCFTSLMGQPRIFLRMAQDGLWFSVFAKIDPITQVPSAGIKLTGLGCSILACFIPLEALANLISLGTLMVFSIVDAGVILLRLRTISERTRNTLQNDAREQEKRRIGAVHDNIVYLLLAFFLLLLGSSLTIRNYDSLMWLAVLLIFAAFICAFIIAGLPPTWVLRESQHDVHDHSKGFNCPWMPFLPLLGLGCNTFMMGSLPLSAWLFCLLWFSLAMVVYFSYGIKYSVLGVKSREEDTVPLLVLKDGSREQNIGYGTDTR